MAKDKDPFLKQTQDLIDRYQEAAALVANLEQGRAEARDKDLDVHAQAIRTGADVPDEPEHEAALDKELAGAIRTRDAFQRAVEGAMADVASYRLEACSRLQQDISAALDGRSQELAKHARAAAALFAEYEDGQLVAKRVGGPRQGAPENSGAPMDSAVLIGPMSTRTISAGPARGDVEAVLSYLASLGQPATIVGGVGGAGSRWALVPE